jgi:hypothetical protein
MREIEKADIAPIEPLLCSVEAGTAIIGRSSGSSSMRSHAAS